MIIKPFACCGWIALVFVVASFECGSSQAAADAPADLMVRDVTTRSQASQRIYDRLDQPAELNVEDQRLDKVLQLISDTHGINIVIDHKAMEKLGEGVKRPFSIDAKDVPLRKALQLLFDGRFIDYYIDGEMLRITDRDDVRARQEIRVYDVQPLLKDGATGQDVADLLNSGRLLKNSAKAQPIGGLVAVVGNRHVHDSILRQLRQTDAEDVLVFRAAQDTFPRGRR
ncbi:MAG TPA: hypothetical protein VM510_10635 [Caulifigura sp.]|nr:hypothetical protein [Caulifigura sp.]